MMPSLNTIVVLTMALSAAWAVPTTTNDGLPPRRVELAERASPTGINNRGSGFCGSENAVDDMKGFIQDSVQDEIIFPDGFHIACAKGNHCCFPQGSSGIMGWEAKKLIGLLADKSDVKSCGSVPVSLLPEYGSDNHLSTAGMLTCNYVANTDNPCPPGVCPPSMAGSTCPA